MPSNGTKLSTATGDFNHDGHLDLAAPNSSSISVFLGNGDGTFQNGVNYSTGAQPVSVITADFNNVTSIWPPTAPSHNQVSVLLGNGDGTFQHRVVSTCNNPVDIVPADFNGDGILDLFVQAGNGGYILSSKGDGTFTPAGSVSPLTSGYINVADVNGDGEPDIIISDQQSASVLVIINKGNGTFQPPAEYFAGLFNFQFTIGDFNGDLFPDLAVIDASQDLFILLNTGK